MADSAKSDRFRNRSVEDLADAVEILEIEDDLDTGMHRVNSCPTPA